MRKKDVFFWLLIVSFIFGISLDWPVWCKFIVSIFSIGLIFQIISHLFKAYKK